jgi:hypothetical protein
MLKKKKTYMFQFLILETIEDGIEVKKTYEMKRLITGNSMSNFYIYNYILIFDEIKDIKIIISKKERNYGSINDVWLWPRVTMPVFLEKSEDNRYLCGRSLEDYKEKYRKIREKELLNSIPKRIMDLLKIKPYNFNE